MYIIGIDPGPITGVALLLINNDLPRLIGRSALQTTPDLLSAVLTGLCHRMPERLTAVAIERFVVGSRAGRSSTANAGEMARDVVALVADLTLTLGPYPVYQRSAAEVKPWATDDRLTAAGITEVTTGMRHARDAGRHALFCACRDFGLPDPLSKKARA